MRYNELIMKKYILIALSALAVPAVSFADIAVGPNFKDGFGMDDVLEIALQYAPIILGIVVIAVIVGVVLIVKRIRRNKNAGIPR